MESGVYSEMEYISQSGVLPKYNQLHEHFKLEAQLHVVMM